MTNRLFIRLLIVFYFFMAGDALLGAFGAEDRKLSVSISNAKCDDLGKPALTWEIANSEKEPVYVYSTFLKGPSASSSYDTASHVYTIWTSLPKEAAYSVNDYPKADFVQLKPGQVLRGRFVERRENTCAGCGSVPREATRIAIQVAFGLSTESVESELRQGHYVHPGNPIVRWQQIAMSPSIQLATCGLN